MIPSFEHTVLFYSFCGTLHVFFVLAVQEKSHLRALNGYT